jgi:hypothetical protein
MKVFGRPPPRPRDRWVANYVLILLLAGVAYTSIPAILANGVRSYAIEHDGWHWTTGNGRIVLARVHSVDGRFPYPIWNDVFDAPAIIGFRVYSGSGGLGGSYTGITLICVPHWFLAALFTGAAVWWVWRDGLIVPTFSFPRRGFEPIMKDPPSTPPAPAARIEG